MNPKCPSVFRRTLAAALASAALAAAPAGHATNNPWLDAYTGYNANYGTTYTGSANAAVLAWQESFVLRSYLNLFEASRQTAWLTEFTTHFDIVKGKATNFEGDGYLRWVTDDYSPNLAALSPDFETADAGDPKLPAGWVRSGSTDATAYRTQTDYVPGGTTCKPKIWGLALKTLTGATQQRIYQPVGSYEPNRPYHLSFAARNAGSVDGRLFVYNRSTNSVVASQRVTSATWTVYQLDFTTPASGNLEIWLAPYTSNNPADQVMYFDNIRIATDFSYAVLDGMIGTPVAEFVRIAHRNPALPQAIHDKAGEYKAFLEQLIASWNDSNGFYGNTWTSVSGTEGYYSEPANHDTFATGVLSPLPHNQYLALLQVQRILHDVNGNSTYLDQATKGAAFFRNYLIASGNTYIWRYSTQAGTKYEDNSHANVDVEAVHTWHKEGGSVFSDADMARLTATFTTNLYNGSVTDPQLHNLVTGGDGSPGYCDDYLFSRAMWGWVPYARFDPGVWLIAALYYDGLGIFDPVRAVTLSQIILWDPVKLTNQSFELAAPGDSTLPARWTRFQSSGLTAYRDAANKTYGVCGLTILSDATHWQKLTQPWTLYTAGASYTVTFDCKTDTSGANGKVWIYNKTAGATIASTTFTNTSWQTRTLTFTAPANDTDVVEIQLGHAVLLNGGQTSFDNVSIKRSTDAW